MFKEELNLELLLEEFMFDLKVQNYSERTSGTYFYNSRLLINYLKDEGVLSADEVRVAHLKGFVHFMQAQGFKSNYINTCLKCARQFFNYLVRESYIPSNPLAKISPLKEDKEVIRTFIDEEVVRMLNAYSYKTYLEARNKLIIAVFVDTGIRLSELIKLQENWIEDSVIRIHGKGSKWRYVPISPNLKKMILRFNRIREGYFQRIEAKEGNYFLSRSGRHLSTVMVENVVRKAGERAKVRKEIRCSPHTLRHYALQAYLRQGLDVYSVSRIAGHEGIQVTNRYLQGLHSEDILERASTRSPLSGLKEL